MSVVVFYYLLYLDAMHMTIAIHPLQVVGKCCEIIRAPDQLFLSVSINVHGHALFDSLYQIQLVTASLQNNSGNNCKDSLYGVVVTSINS